MDPRSELQLLLRKYLPEQELERALKLLQESHEQAWEDGQAWED